jgi:DNA-binding winged helix-turn-helix (wHTH) protein
MCTIIAIMKVRYLLGNMGPERCFNIRTLVRVGFVVSTAINTSTMDTLSINVVAIIHHAAAPAHATIIVIQRSLVFQ